MDLQGRNLRLDMQGPDVELLLQELRSLRFDIPASETAFGRATLEAVMFLQGWERLGPTGIVDEPTAAAINRLFHQIGAGGTLSGIVVSQFGDPLAGALVEALGLGLSGRTDDDGRYEIGPISTGLVQLRASAAEYAAEQAEALVEGGQSAARDFTLKRAETLMVRGRVRHQDGRRLVNAVVRAFDRDLRREELLGETKPDATGHYEIRYARDGFARAEKENADLVVRAFAPDGRELAVSPVLFNAPATADVDLTVAAGVWDLPSLFETLGLAVSPLMGDVALEELDEDAEHRDLSFLAGETGFAWELLARFVVSYRMPGEGLEPEFWFAVLGGGALRISEARSLSDQLPSLAQMAAGLDIGAVQKSLTGAFNLKEIAEKLRERVPAWMEAFKPPALLPTAAGIPVSNALRSPRMVRTAAYVSAARFHAIRASSPVNPARCRRDHPTPANRRSRQPGAVSRRRDLRQDPQQEVSRGVSHRRLRWRHGTCHAEWRSQGPRPRPRDQPAAGRAPAV